MAHFSHEKTINKNSSMAKQIQKFKTLQKLWRHLGYTLYMVNSFRTPQHSLLLI